MRKQVIFPTLGFLIALLFCSGARADSLLVGAAASLTNAMTDIGNAFTRANPGTTMRFTFASSGALVQQIQQGAPIDVFAPASPKEMDTLATQKAILSDTRLDFAGNRLVLIAKNGSLIKRWEDLALPTVKRIAISDPASVPSGRYAKETLTRRKLWSAIEYKAVFGQNVRQTLAYVANGDVDAGIVFATDSQQEKQRVRIVAEAIPGKDHSPIVYPAAVVTRSRNADAARRFIRFLQSTTAREILARYGFSPLPARPTNKPRGG